MQKLRHSWLPLLAASLFAVLPPPASAKNLAVNLTLQRGTDTNGNAIGNEWCWAACSKMILDYYGYPEAITSIVAYGVGDASYDTWNYAWSSGSEKRENVAIWEPKEGGGYERKKKTIDPLMWNGNDKIIDHFSNQEVSTQVHRVALSADDIKTEIDDRDAPFVRRIGWDSGGGHFTVVYGVNAGVLSIHDPWYGSYVASDAVARRGAIGASNYTWTSTVTTSKIIDVLFLVDTTGSMSSYISAAKSSASALLDKIASKFKNYRVAVANYKDFPKSPYGEDEDYVYAANQAFTKDKATAQAGINAIPDATGGSDIPEAVFSALYNGLHGAGLADGDGVTWRPDPAKRIIILIGDAEGHSPEPWRGGRSFSDVVRLATNPALPISVHALWAGASIKAGNQFKSIAGGTGGGTVHASEGGETGGAVQQIIDNVAAGPRFPSGDTGAIFPTFAFDLFGAGLGGMTADARQFLLEIQKKDPVSGDYLPLRLVRLPKATTATYYSKKPFAQGEYRWRLGFKRPGSNLFLPSDASEDPPVDAEPTDPVRRSVRGGEKVKPVVTFETEFTEFTRIPNPPAAPTKLSPSTNFTGTRAPISFAFTTVPDATKYVLQVQETKLVDGVPQTKVVKNVRIAAPKNDAGSVTLFKKIGLKQGASYSWRIQGLNYDRPKVDDTAW